MSTQKFAKDQPTGFSNRIERVAIVGAGGRQGAQITEQLLKTGKHAVTALTRIGSTSKLSDNVKAIAVNYEDEESVASALKDQQLLVITLAVNVDPEVHHRIVRAAGKAGIRYIIPNIYAANVVIENQGSVDGFFPAAPPINLLKEIERVGVSSWILLVGGVWFDYSLPSGESFMGFDIDNRKVTLFDDGEAKINTSTLAQFGRAAAAIASLKELPNDGHDKSPTIGQFRNKPVYLSSFYVSQKDILKSIQHVTSTADADWEIKYESSANRIENGKAMGRSGNIMGFVQAYYSFIFSPEGQKLRTQDKLHNGPLSMPEEDLDEVVKDCVERAENKFRPLYQQVRQITSVTSTAPVSRGTNKLNLGILNFCHTMSFGFGVGDFIAVGELCWKIYTRVYKVSRDAPEELRALIQELGNLSNTVNLLNEEVRDQEEWIKQAGERRLEYTCKVMSQAKETLQKMDRLADKYAELDPGVNSQGSKRSLRIQWNRIKYAFEVSSINELRAKVWIPAQVPRNQLVSGINVHQFMSHNFYLTLLLQGAQNSSLERIEKQQSKTDMKLEELRNFMIGDRISRETPLLKAPLEEEVRVELSAAFLRSAETGASDDRRNDEIRKLSQTAKTSLEGFPRFDIQLHDIEGYIMHIWLQRAPLSTISPRRQLNLDRDNPSWHTSDGDVLFQWAIIIDLAEKGCQEKITDSKFLARDLSVELPPGYRDWKVICWHCEKFADIEPLFKKFNVRNDLHRYLIQTAFLRLDRSLLCQLACHMDYGDRWRPDDVLIMVEASLSSDDAGYLLWILENVANSVICGHRIAILQLVYNSRRLNHIDTMLQFFIPRPADIAAAIAWYLVSNEEQSFESFLHLIEDHGGSFSSKTAEEVDFTDFYPTFAASCGRLIESKCSNTLRLYIRHFSASYWNEKS
ncbi:oxidoreductase like [Fusarium mexicanum]|uniref:Oxidoreductase like n=1 Tax=Fusarium mexicanum TaxID=751941 RepID=A0A8H5MXQ4_9HYPO|nr:oxidoreductase like [Fusarium mexicanum]